MNLVTMFIFLKVGLDIQMVSFLLDVIVHIRNKYCVVCLFDGDTV